MKENISQIQFSIKHFYLNLQTITNVLSGPDTVVIPAQSEYRGSLTWDYIPGRCIPICIASPGPIICTVIDPMIEAATTLLQSVRAQGLKVNHRRAGECRENIIIWGDPGRWQRYTCIPSLTSPKISRTINHPWKLSKWVYFRILWYQLCLLWCLSDCIVKLQRSERDFSLWT